MLNWVLSKFSAVKKAGEVVTKSKTYLGGAVLLLGGAAQCLAGAASIASAIAAVDSAQGLVALARGAASLPGLADINSGAVMFAAGLVAVGLRHAVAKASEPAK